MFQHFIITRFNLHSKEWSRTRNNTQVLSDDWMSNRLKLFEDYCYSSLSGQTNHDFLWLVFFDSNTADKYRKKILKLEHEFPLFKAIYIDGMSNFLPSIKKEISKLLCSPYLITTRVDNDDCLHEDYVDEVHKLFSEQDYMVVDFINGLTLQIEPEVKLGRRQHVNNPFITLIESSEGFQTIWSKKHGAWKKVARPYTLSLQPLWLSVIHSENKINNFLGYGNVDWEELSGFNISNTVNMLLQKSNVSHKEWLWQSGKNRLATKWNIAFKVSRQYLFKIL